jgi:hypothetical protein
MSSVNVRLLSMFFVLSAFGGYAQNRNSAKKIKTSEDYKMFAYGVTTNTNSGLLGGVVVRHSSLIGNVKGHPMHRYIALEAVNIKHPKEKSEATSIANRFIFGKTNYLFSLRPEYGREIVYFRKNGEDGIGISLIMAGGPSIGIQKPYYIKYDRTGRGQIEVVQYDPNIHKELNRIQGSAGILTEFFKGMSINPGAHVKLAANIDMNTFGNSLTGFEIGITSEIFSKTPEIMSAQLTANARFFTSGYLTIYFGNRKQKK